MRGFEPEDLLDEPDCPLTEYDLAPFFFPSDERLEEVGLRGIYLSNYMEWKAKSQAEFVIENLDFETAQSRERTFNLYDKLDDVHANGAHDYLKYLKFGYGRATDDASSEIRHGRIAREEGIELVSKFDHVRPSDLDIFLNAVGMTEEEFVGMVEPMRDPSIWAKDERGRWNVTDSVANHINDPGVEEASIPLKDKGAHLFNQSSSKTSPHCQSTGKQTEYVIL